MLSIFKGWFGEKMTTLGMWLGLDETVYQRVHDVVVPAANGTTQIDHVLVSVYGIFVIETKNMKGWIFGSESDPQWTQSVFGRKHRFQNPLRQNYRHIRCLSDHLRLDEQMFHSVVFFIGDCEFKTPLPKNVLNYGLSGYIKGFQQPYLTKAQVEEVMSSLRALKQDGISRGEHLASLQARHESTTVCPRCGAPLLTRTAKKGPAAGKQFFGCSTYPKCHYKRDV